MKADEEVQFREGVVLDRPTRTNAGSGSFVECGLKKVSQIMLPSTMRQNGLPSDEECSSRQAHSTRCPSHCDDGTLLEERLVQSCDIM